LSARSTKHLSSPNLAGLVKIHSLGASLSISDRVRWGEISLHAQPRDEGVRREEGKLVLQMSTITDDFDHEIFQVGDSVAIIDCLTFVPEFIPVLKALEHQQMSLLPFEDGKQLNICKEYFWHPIKATVDLNFARSIPLLIQEMIEMSTLGPIIEIRRDESLKDQLVDKLSSLVTKTTLDRTQLISFIEALENPVHLTQGPPGTGKSYLGVVIVRALLLVRSFWMRVNPSVGTPPILVLSYKNHAIDEFLCDLVKAEGTSGVLSRRLIRIGGSCNEPRLLPYSEKSIRKSDAEVMLSRRKVEGLHDVLNECTQIVDIAFKFLSYQVDMFEIQGESDNTFRKRFLRAGWEATEILVTSLMRVAKLVAEFANGEDEENKDPDLRFISWDSAKLRVCVTKKAIIQQIQGLYDGIQHYNRQRGGAASFDEPEDVLLMWLQGIFPLPLCCYNSEHGNRCSFLAASHEVDLCVSHACSHEKDGTTCCKRVVRGKYLCTDHVCNAEQCSKPKLESPQIFCKEHACFKCLQQTDEIVANLAIDEAPRNACVLHPLCVAADCSEVCLPDKDYCEKHISHLCSGQTKKGNKCTLRAISRELPFCQDHRWQHIPDVQEPNDSNSIDGSSSDEEEQILICQGQTSKKKPCKAPAQPKLRYCEAHVGQDPISAIKAARESRAEPPAAQTTEMPIDSRDDQSLLDLACGAHDGDAEKTSLIGGETVRTVEIKDPCDDTLPQIDGAEDTAQPCLDDDASDYDSASSQIGDTAQPCLDDDASDYDSASSQISEVGDYDNKDEVDEGGNLQHLRDVFHVDSEDSSDAEDESVCDKEEEDSATELPTENGQVKALLWKEPSQWTWRMSREERWSACLTFLEHQSELMGHVKTRLKSKIRVADKELRNAKTRASAKIYEDKAVIGGTIVGCISRLEAIRSTNPFAIIVEEASEVSEPLLLSCFCASTVKLEMIGDHLQLQPSMMSKFDFERVNKVDVSMFERLIRAPSSHAAPSSVLSVQRRMRSSICDFTRDYYKDIIEIEDHKVCSTRCIPGPVALRSQSKGRDILGMDSNIFLWTHSGDQKKANVGLSKINPHEADMVCKLAEYLVECGVPKPSIAILTPYKGQLMLIRDNLLKKSKKKLLSWNADETDVLRVSTVDRFQGDEADIVLISLVVDAKSKTPFVKKVNRMIVLLSRAKLGMYIVGNVGYFENDAIKQGDAKHWATTLNMLTSPCTSDPSLPFDLESPSARNGSKIILCCPQHCHVKYATSDPSKLVKKFCTELCDKTLSCSHPCLRPCHWPQEQHNQRCIFPMQPPCSKHCAAIACHVVFANASAAKKGCTILDALPHFRCPGTLFDFITTCTCTHLTPACYCMICTF